MTPVLKDSELEAQLDKEGYVVLPFLNESEVAYLIDLYNKHHTETKEGLYATAHSSDRDFKMNLNFEILKQFDYAIFLTTKFLTRCSVCLRKVFS